MYDSHQIPCVFFQEESRVEGNIIQNDVWRILYFLSRHGVEALFIHYHICSSNRPTKWVLLPLFDKWKNRGSERCNDFPNVTLLAGGRARFKPRFNSRDWSSPVLHNASHKTTFIRIIMVIINSANNYWGLTLCCAKLSYVTLRKH